MSILSNLMKNAGLEGVHEEAEKIKDKDFDKFWKYEVLGVLIDIASTLHTICLDTGDISEKRKKQKKPEKST